MPIKMVLEEEFAVHPKTEGIHTHWATNRL